MKTKKFEGITVWVDNLISGKTFIPAARLAEMFEVWLKTKERSWLEYYWLDPAIRAFMTDKPPGCNGTFEQKDFNGVYDFLRPIAEKYMSEIEKVKVN